jgi:hypothetical protein
MGLEILVTTQGDGRNAIPTPETRKRYDILADEDQREAVSVRIRELVDQIFTEVQEAVKVECEVEVQVSGKVTLTGKADAKFLIFDIGGGASTETTMTITMSAKLSPREPQATRKRR